jgi:hypothetical protein
MAAAAAAAFRFIKSALSGDDCLSPPEMVKSVGDAGNYNNN